MKRRKIYSRGFTMIELVVVIIVIAILAAIALPKYNLAVERARATEAMSVLAAIREAQMRYAIENDGYTDDITELDIGSSVGGIAKYFEFSAVQQGTPFDEDDNVVAQATRNSINRLYEVYTPTITENGVISGIELSVPGGLGYFVTRIFNPGVAAPTVVIEEED